jgi:hypothetical protein
VVIAGSSTQNLFDANITTSRTAAGNETWEVGSVSGCAAGLETYPK